MKCVLPTGGSTADTSTDMEKPSSFAEESVPLSCVICMQKMANNEPILLEDDVLPTRAEPEPPQENWGVNGRRPGQFRSTGIQVNLPETCPATMEKPTPQHIVDEEALLQLMKNCPMCNRKCRCSKHTRGPYFIVYQSRYFCDYQRKWASQPEAKNMNIHKAYTPPKRRLQPKGKVSVNAKAQSSQLNKTRVSEYHNPLET